MMLPVNDANEQLTPDFQEIIGPTKNYRLILDGDRVIGFTDELQAMAQAIYLILSVERYDHVIYSYNAGVEFKDLFGKPVTYVATEVKKRIREALIQDDRINEVDNFEVSINKNSVIVKFTAHTIFGDIESEREVLF